MLASGLSNDYCFFKLMIYYTKFIIRGSRLVPNHKVKITPDHHCWVRALIIVLVSVSTRNSNNLLFLIQKHNFLLFVLGIFLIKIKDQFSLCIKLETSHMKTTIWINFDLVNDLRYFVLCEGMLFVWTLRCFLASAQDKVKIVSRNFNRFKTEI